MFNPYLLCISGWRVTDTCAWSLPQSEDFIHSSAPTYNITTITQYGRASSKHGVEDHRNENICILKYLISPGFCFESEQSLIEENGLFLCRIYYLLQYS